MKIGWISTVAFSALATVYLMWGETDTPLGFVLSLLSTMWLMFVCVGIMTGVWV